MTMTQFEYSATVSEVHDMTMAQMQEYLIDYNIATEDEIRLVTSIAGYNEDTMRDILYVRTGLHSFEQLLEEVA